MYMKKKQLKCLYGKIFYIKQQNIQGLNIELIKETDKTTTIFCEIPGTTKNAGTVLLYGHFDKQPNMDGWMEGLEVTNPVIRDGKLYGRGSSDDSKK